MSTETKTCRTCHEEKTLDWFGSAVKNTKNDQLNYHCRPCMRLKRRANKEARLDAMTHEELQAYEQKIRDEKVRYRLKNPEKVKEQRKRDRLLSNLPKWTEELDLLVPLLADFESATGDDFERYGRWPGDLITHPDKALASRWSDSVSKLRWFGNQMNRDGLTCNPHAIIVHRIEFLQGNLDSATAEEKAAALARQSNTDSNWHGGIPRSQRIAMEETRKRWEIERQEARALMTPEERADERAFMDSFWFVLNRTRGQLDQHDADNAARLHGKAMQKLAEYQRGGTKWSSVAKAERAADEAQNDQLREDEEVQKHRYREVYPIYLKEEQAKDRES